MLLEDYDVLEKHWENNIQVFRVREKQGGGVFQIHEFFFGETITEFDRLSQELPAIPRQVSRVVKINKDGPSGYIVTELLPDNVGIQDWIRSLSEPPRPPASPLSDAPSLNQASVANLRKLEMDHGALQPMIPGPERTPLASESVQTQASDQASAIYELAVKRRQMKNGNGSMAPVADGKPDPQQASSPLPPVPASRTVASSPQEIKPAAARVMPAPAAEPGTAKRETSAQPTAPNRITDFLLPNSRRPGPLPTLPVAAPRPLVPQVPIETTTAPPDAEPGLGTWLTPNETKPATPSPPHSSAIVSSGQEAFPAPKPAAARSGPHVELGSPPVLVAQVAETRPVAIPQAPQPRWSSAGPANVRPLGATVKPPAARTTSAQAPGNWSLTIWTVAGLGLVLAAVLLIMEKIG